MKLNWLFALVGATVAMAVPGSEPVELYDETQLYHELASVEKLIHHLSERKSFIQRALDIEADPLKLFHSAFIPIATVEEVKDEPLLFVDILRVTRKDKLGPVHIPIASTKDGHIYIFDAVGGAPLLKFTSYDEADISEDHAPACTTNECPIPGDRLVKEFSFAKDMRVGSGGSKPFIAVLQENGVVKVHGMAVKRGNLYEKSSFWRDDAKDIQPSSESEPQTQITTRRGVYIHSNATVTVMEVFSTAYKSVLIMGTSSGEVHFVEPSSAATGKGSFPIVRVADNVAVTHLSITGNQLAVGLQDGSIRFVTLGTNKLVPSPKCSVPVGLGSIGTMSWIESKVPGDKSRYIMVHTTEEDVLLFDRRSPEVPTSTAATKSKSTSTSGGFLAKLFGATPGKTCNVVRRFPSMQAGSMVTLPQSQLLILTKRGPEVYSSSTFFATHGHYDSAHDINNVRRVDFISAGSAVDFAVVLVRTDGKGAHVYSFIPSGASETGLTDGAGGAETLMENAAASWFSAASGSRGPFVLVLAGLGFVMAWKRRLFSRGNNQEPWNSTSNSRFRARRGLAGSRGMNVMGGGDPLEAFAKFNAMNDGDSVRYDPPPRVAQGLVSEGAGVTFEDD